MNTKGQNYIQGIVALVVGLIIVFAIPGVKAYFDQLFNAILVGIIGGIIVGAIIFVLWYLFNRD